MCGRKEKERRQKKEKSNNSTLSPFSSKLCMFLGWFLTNVLSVTALVLHEMTSLCAVICRWQQCKMLYRAPRLFATTTSLSLNLSLFFSLPLYLVYFGLIERRCVPVSQNKDAKQRQIELLFGVQLVTTVTSGDISLLRCKGGDGAASKTTLTC